MEDIRERMRALIDKLNIAADAYYNGKNEVMSDYEWDALFDELKKLEEESGIVLQGSPTHKVSADNNDSGEKEKHEFAALSLAKTKSREEMIKWADGREVYISWKLDGLTLVATYDDGKLTHLVTRGDGETGTSVMRLYSSIFDIPEKINYKGHLVVRGEAIISYDDFNVFLLETGEDYANPRNLAAGSLTLKDPQEVKNRKIHFIAFSLVYSEDEIFSYKTRMDFLAENGFKCVESRYAGSPEEISDTIDYFSKKVESGEMKYPVDGLVMVYNDTDYASGGNVTGHHATRAGLAFKWQDESAVTMLDHIEWSCAYSAITPVAVFKPVKLEGTKVSRASLCNISECKRLDIGGAGSELEVIKANKIIPKVISVKKKDGELEIPDICPVCGGSTIVFVSDSGTETLRCQNNDCAAKKIKRFSRFVSKKGINIDGISEQTVSKFINLGWIRDFSDFYHLDSHIEQLKELEGFGDKSTANILSSVEKSRTVSDRNFLYSLNIPLCGEDVCKKLLSGYALGNLIEKAHDSIDDPEVFAELDGIGPEKSTKFVEFFANEYNYTQVKELLKELEIEASEKNTGKGNCTGLTFVITGDVYKYKNRNELKAYIESQGGKVTGSVTGKTDYLINNDSESSSSKNRRAKELGIPVITEDEFIETFVNS